MALPRMNFQRMIASLDQQSLSNLMDLHVQRSKYGHCQGIDLFAHLQRAAFEALREYIYKEKTQR